jgi:hypothetical protein
MMILGCLGYSPRRSAAYPRANNEQQLCKLTESSARAATGIACLGELVKQNRCLFVFSLGL